MLLHIIMFGFTMLAVVLVCYFTIILTLQVQWSPHNEIILVSSGTDRRLYVWDLRYVYMHKDNYKHLLI